MSENPYEASGQATAAAESHDQAPFLRPKVVIKLAVLVYVLSYIPLSLGGRYIGTFVSLSGVDMMWIPFGYVRDRQLTALYYLYYPVWAIDSTIIHRQYKATGAEAVRECARQDGD
jgi:hypothetical protein